MDEKQLQELYNSMTLKDPSYKDYMPFESFKQKMADKAYYDKVLSFVGAEPKKTDASKITGELTQQKPASPISPVLPAYYKEPGKPAVDVRGELTEPAKKTEQAPVSAPTTSAISTAEQIGGSYKPDQVEVQKILAANEKWSKPQEKEKDYFTGTAALIKRKIDEVIPIGMGEFVEDLFRAASSGLSQGEVNSKAYKFLKNGVDVSMDDIQNYIESNQRLRDIGPSEAMQKYQETYEKEGSDFWGVIKGIYENPAVLPELILSSTTQLMSNPDAITGFFSTVGVGAAQGAGTGAAAAGVGSVPGALAGAARSLPYAFALAGTISEMGATFSELLQEELGGNEMTKDNVREILEDPDKLSSITNKAVVRGLTIGVIDAYTGKLASGVGAKVIARSAQKSATGAVTKGALLRGTAAEASVEMTGGSFGEAAGRASIGQDMDMSEILLEGAAELPGSIKSLVQSKLARPEYKVNGERVSGQIVDRLIETMTPEQLAKTKFDIKNDFEGKSKVIQDKVVTGSIKNEVIQASPNLSEENVNKIVELEKELRGLADNKTQVGKDKAAEIRSQIKNIQQNAIQEQSADAGVLRGEGPQVGLQEVVQGDQEPQVATGGTQAQVTAQQPSVQITGLSISDPEIDTRITDEKQKGVLSFAKKAVNAISSIMPGVEFVVHDNSDSYAAAVSQRIGKESKDVAGTSGYFTYGPDGSVRIDLDLSSANNRTVAHEVTHAVLYKKFNEDFTLFKDFRDRLSGVISSMAPQDFVTDAGTDVKVTTVKEQLAEFVSRYKSQGDEVKAEEFITELSAMLANNEAKISTSGWNKISSFIGDFVSKITGGKINLFEGARTTRDVVDFFNSMSKAIATGEDISGINFARRGGQAPATGQVAQGGNASISDEDKYKPLPGAPTKAKDIAGPDPKLVSVAEQYAKENGIDFKRQGEYVEIDEAFSKRIAQAFEDMKHDPSNEKVKEAYSDLIRQTMAQYDALIKAGYEFSFFDSKTDPYKGNPSDAMRDLRSNKKMAVYGTYDGYGTEGITAKEQAENPLLEDTGLRWKDQNGVEKPVTANDLFRAVHDAFGHGLEGAGFRARGEENAWQAHVRLFQGPAVGAITTETRGQNSWLNFGPYGEKNRTAKLEDTVFGEQKIGLMPEWTWMERRAPDYQAQAEIKPEVKGKASVLSDYRDNKRFKFSDLKYPDTVLGKVKEGKDINTAISFYEKIVRVFNKLFDRNVKVYSKKNKNNFGVTVEYETGLKPKYFSYPTSKMGEHVVVDKIDKFTPLTSLRHELIHEMLVKNITDKFERINEMDQSAVSESIENVQRNRAYNYSLEDVFFERVVENIERLPDNKDTFPIETYAQDVVNRLVSELNNESPSKEEVDTKLNELLEGSNPWLKKNLTDAVGKADFNKPLKESIDKIGKYFSDRFTVSKDIFPKDLQEKIFKFTEIFNDEYQGVLTRLKSTEKAKPAVKGKASMKAVEETAKALEEAGLNNVLKGALKGYSGYIHKTTKESYDSIVKNGWNKDINNIWLSPDDTASYGDYEMGVYIKINNPLVLDKYYEDKNGKKTDAYDISKNRKLYESLGGEANSNSFTELRNAGYDSIIEDNGDVASLYPEDAIFSDSPISVAEAYHKAKEDGSSPELVKAVEKAIGAKPEVKGKASRMAPENEVSEKTLPGYDFLVAGIAKYVSNAISRGDAKADIVRTAVDIAQSSPIYESANDVQREQIVREVRTISGESDKTPPSTSKILGKEKKKLLVDDYKALKDQIRLEARAAKEGAKSVSDAVRAITKYFNEIKDRGNLTRSDISKVLNIISGVKNQDTLDKAADKIFGIVDQAKSDIIEVSEYKALKDQIRLEARAARESKGDVNAKRKNLSDAVRKLAASGNVSAKKVSAIINKISNLNLYSAKKVNDFIQYATNVFADADYAEKLNTANATRRQIKKLSKSADKFANLRDLGSRFSEIDPSLVDDIDEYNKIASLLKESIKGSTTRGAEARFATIASEEQVNKYISDAMETQDQKMLDAKIEEAQDLLGFDATGMTYDEILELLESPKSIAKDIENMVRAGINKAFDIYKTIIKDIINTGVDSFTGAPVNYTDNQKRIIQQFIDIDPGKLNVKQALEAVDALVNFITNGSIARMESVVEKYNGKENMIKAEQKGIKGRVVKKYGSKSFGRLLVEQTANLNILFERVFGGFNRAGFMEKMIGITDIKNGVSKARSEANAVVKQYVENFYGKKANGQAFNTAYNNIERGMVAFLTRSVFGSKKEIDQEFQRRKDLILKIDKDGKRTGSIAELEKGNEQEVKKAKIYQEIFDKIARDSKNYQEVTSKADPVNVDAVDFWRQKWDERYQRLSDVALGIYNKVLGRDVNYSPDRLTRLSYDTGDFDISSDDMSFIFNSGNAGIYKKETGVLMTATRPESLPTNTKTGEANRYVDLSFDNNNSNSIYDALVDINTAGAIRRSESAMNSSAFRRMVDSSDDRKMIEGRVRLYVNNARKKNPFSDDEFSKAAKKLNRLATIGVGQALGGVLQPIKQVIPIAMNTIINAGGLNVSSISNKSVQDFINKSGYAIANRGIESQAQIESLDKMIEDAASSRAGKAIDKIESINKWWLKNLLVRFDVGIARASWITYYEQYLKKNGIDPSTIDYSTHEINEEAADYAQRQVDRQQNVSDSDLSGAILSSKDASKQLFTKIMMPFASFRMNQSARLGSDISTLLNSTSTKEDKVVAARSLAGFMAEMATFRALSYGSALVIGSVVAGMMGKDDDEEEEEKKRAARIKGQLTNTVADMFSPAPILDRLVQLGVSKTLESVQDAYEVEKEDRIEIYSGDKQTMFQSLGLLGITAERADQLWEMSKLYKEGTFKDNYGNEKELLESDRDVIGKMIPVAIMSGIGLAPTEFNSVVRGVVKEAKRGADRVSQAKQEDYKPETPRERRERILKEKRDRINKRRASR